MTTLIINIKDTASTREIVDLLRLNDGVMDITIEEELDFEPIPGLPYTREERIASIREAEEDYLAGRFVTSDELRAKHPRL